VEKFEAELRAKQQPPAEEVAPPLPPKIAAPPPPAPEHPPLLQPMAPGVTLISPRLAALPLISMRDALLLSSPLHSARFAREQGALRRGLSRAPVPSPRDRLPRRRRRLHARARHHVLQRALPARPPHRRRRRRHRQRRRRRQSLRGLRRQQARRARPARARRGGRPALSPRAAPR
jgi:type VI secretion system secreted protein VgrG